MFQEVFLIPTQKRGALAPLFFMDNGLTRSCLQGHMGQVFGDHPLNPRAAILMIGDFACVGGDPKSYAARRLVGKLQLHKGREWVIPAADGWEDHFLYWHPKRMEKAMRYAVECKTAFDEEKLKSMAAALPSGFALRDMDGGLYAKAMAGAWSRDFVSQFDDAYDYLRRGMGVAVMYGDELVAGASSYVVYDGGIEIQTDTREDMRRRGLASACCAQLILRALCNRINPTWDAANEVSLALSEKLGYSLSSPYEIWEVTY